MTTAELIQACRTRLAQMRERDGDLIASARTDLPALLTWAEQELDQDEAERQAGEERAILAWKRISRFARALGVL